MTTEILVLMWHGTAQVYTLPTDPTFKGYKPGSVFYGSEVGNGLPSTAYASYDMVEAGRSLIAAALQGELQGLYTADGQVITDCERRIRLWWSRPQRHLPCPVLNLPSYTISTLGQICLSCLWPYRDAYRKIMCPCMHADRLNQRFVHLSESCIPLYPPALIYMQLLHEQKSRVHVSDPDE